MLLVCLVYGAKLQDGYGDQFYVDSRVENRKNKASAKRTHIRVVIGAGLLGLECTQSLGA